MKNPDTIQKEISDLKHEQTLLSARLENAKDESARLFLENLINYNEEMISSLVDKQNELSK